MLRLGFGSGIDPQLAWSAFPDGAVDFYNKRWLDYTGLQPEAAARGPAE